MLALPPHSRTLLAADTPARPPPTTSTSRPHQRKTMHVQSACIDAQAVAIACAILHATNGKPHHQSTIMLTEVQLQISIADPARATSLCFFNRLNHDTPARGHSKPAFGAREDRSSLRAEVCCTGRHQERLQKALYALDSLFADKPLAWPCFLWCCDSAV